MPDPFEISRRKIAWAKKNLTDLKREVDLVLSDPNFHEIVVEPHPTKPNHVIQKLRVAKQLPVFWPDIVGIVVDSLRAALDFAIYDVAVAAGCDKPRNAYFPFSNRLLKN